MSVSKVDLEANGWTVSGDPEDEGTVSWVNPRTGETLDVPRGIDPGWDYNPGNTDALSHAARTAMDKLAVLPPRIASRAVTALDFTLPAVMAELSQWIKGILNAADRGKRRKTGARRVVGALTERTLEFLAAQEIEPATAEISIADEDLLHAVRTAKHHPLPVDTWARLPLLLARPSAIYWDRQDPGLVYVVEEPGGSGKFIVLVNYKTKVNRKRMLVNNVRTGAGLNDLREFDNVGRYERVE